MTRYPVAYHKSDMQKAAFHAASFCATSQKQKGLTEKAYN